MWWYMIIIPAVEAEAGESLRVQGQSELHTTISKKTNKEKTDKQAIHLFFLAYDWDFYPIQEN